MMMRDFQADTPLGVCAQDLEVHQVIHPFSCSLQLLREFTPGRSLSDHLVISRRETEAREKKWLIQDDMTSQCQIRTGPQVHWFSNQCSSHHHLAKMKSKVFLPGVVMLLPQAFRTHCFKEKKHDRYSLFSAEKFKHALLFYSSLLFLTSVSTL